MLWELFEAVSSLRVLVSLLPSPSLCWGPEVFVLGGPVDAGEPLGLTQEAAMLAGAVAPVHPVAAYPLSPRVLLGLHPPPLPRSIQAPLSSQLCHSPVSRCCPSLWQDGGQGWATEVTREGGSTVAGCPRAPAISWGTPGVSLCGVPLHGELLAQGLVVAAGRGCLGTWGFGLAAAGPRFARWQGCQHSSGAACDAAALTSILCRRRSRRGD